MSGRAVRITDIQDRKTRDGKITMLTAYTAWMVLSYGISMPVVFWLARPAGQKIFWRGDRRELL